MHPSKSLPLQHAAHHQQLELFKKLIFNDTRIVYIEPLTKNFFLIKNKEKFLTVTKLSYKTIHDKSKIEIYSY